VRRLQAAITMRPSPEPRFDQHVRWFDLGQVSLRLAGRRQSMKAASCSCDWDATEADGGAGDGAPVPSHSCSLSTRSAGRMVGHFNLASFVDGDDPIEHMFEHQAHAMFALAQAGLQSHTIRGVRPDRDEAGNASVLDNEWQGLAGNCPVSARSLHPGSIR